MSFSFDLKSQMGRNDNPIVQCPCGRDVNLDMMWDVRPVAHKTLWTDTHRCDSCVQHLHRTGALSYEEFYRAHGAPAELIKIHSDRDKHILSEKVVHDDN